jgi:hypothetical protein
MSQPTPPLTGPFSPEERLLILATLAQPTANEAAEALAWAHGDLAWGEFYTLAQENAVLPKVYAALKGMGVWESVEPSVREPWEAHAELIRERNQQRIEAAKPLLVRLLAEGKPVVLLKGACFAELLYGDVAYKKMNDLDFLVSWEVAQGLPAILQELAFIALSKPMASEPRKLRALTHHLPGYVSPNLSCMLGIHWGLTSPLAPYRLDEAAMWERLESLHYQGLPLFALSPMDNLHHVCVHLPHYKTGLRELADIYNLIRLQGDRIDWLTFEADIRKAGTSERVWHALSLVQAIDPDARVAALLDALASCIKASFVRDALHKRANPRLILRSRSTHLTRIEKAYGVFGLTWDLREKAGTLVNMWGGVLFPPLRDVEKMAYLPAGSRRLWLHYPFAWHRVVRALISDLGLKVFLLVTLKELIDLSRCACLTVLNQPRPNSGLADAARRLGFSPQAFERMKELLD